MEIKEKIDEIKANVNFTPEEVKGISHEGIKSFTKGLMAGAGTYVGKKGFPMVVKYGSKGLMAVTTLIKVKVL